MSERQKTAAIAETFAAGRMGAIHIPPGALTALLDPSDTFVGKLVESLAEGQRQREENSKVTP
jgi:hypothetical protein